MFGFRLFFPVFGLLLYQSYLVYSCTSLNGRSGTISDSYVVRGTAPYDKCWTIANPEKNLISFQLRRLDLTSKKPTDGSLQIAFKDDNKAIIYWSQSAMDSFSTTSNLTHIEFAIDSGQYRDNFVASFTLHYETIYIACSQEDNFRCSNNTCIPKNEVCDGIKNCENGADEFGCGAVKMEGAADALSKQITWMKVKRTSSWGWNEHTSRAVVALYLAGAAKFDGKILEEELMAKQAELKTSIALLKNSISNEQLSMFINGLLVTCHNPRHFYGQNLVKRLKEQVESTSNFTHPVAYLTLCNARETWPSRAYEDLNKMLTLNSNYPFITDFQAIATMAVSCLHNLTNFLSGTGNTDLKTSYDNAIKNFKGMQFPDGRFGNLHTTSLITQALLSSGQEFATDWKLNATMKYIIQSLTKSPDILARFLTLPVLNAASLVDVSKVNCTLNPRRSGYDKLSYEISDYAGSKIRVKFSLFVGEDKDVIHTISLRVPVNYTAHNVMNLAQIEDNKFNFKYTTISGVMYVYEINGVTNDPEAGMFWLLYQGLDNTASDLYHYTFGPDQLVMQDKEHLVMWYKKVTF